MTFSHPLQQAIFVGQAWNESFGSKISSRVAKYKDAELQTELLRRFNSNYALSGSVGRKLAAMIGIDYQQFMGCRRTNLNLEFPGKKGKGDAFDRVGGEAMAKILMEDVQNVRFVLLGSEVCKCFGVPYEALVTWERPIRGRDQSFFCLPHPSGINLWYNDPKNRDQASRNLRRFLNVKEDQETSGIQMRS